MSYTLTFSKQAFKELEKINTIKQHLYNQGIKTNDDFITYYYGK